ncbi:OBAP family protein [Pseudomonas sp. FP2309]|uniref:OBAP family protein n=1 Tax=Pseudomonas sp. FP2309 TaxID=2954091 RepID=UPI0027341E8C|nr:OBAP family protein [Pseudomonas sp. FP2309]WLH70910.1 OBAP family protein [Pseudomonas sp. FP2309]
MDTKTTRTAKSLPLAAALTLLSACAGNDTPSNVAAPGKPTAPTTRTLDAGAALLQSRPPIDALNAYLDGFHFYNGHPDVQMEAHHYCAILNDEVIQCVIYDGNRRDAKLMGVEYIISEQLFNSLPTPEKALWHSHVHEVKSGQLVAPGIPEVAEHALMEKLVHTYGKTWHTWHTDLDKRLPLGVPQLMMGFTADGQADPRMVAERDRRMGIDSTEKKHTRADITPPPIAPGADAWRQGTVIQIVDPAIPPHQH